MDPCTSQAHDTPTNQSRVARVRAEANKRLRCHTTASIASMVVLETGGCNAGASQHARRLLRASALCFGVKRTSVNYVPQPTLLAHRFRHDGKVCITRLRLRRYLKCFDYASAMPEKKALSSTCIRFLHVTLEAMVIAAGDCQRQRSRPPLAGPCKLQTVITNHYQDCPKYIARVFIARHTQSSGTRQAKWVRRTPCSHVSTSLQTHESDTN
jgi:hypothetical protein